MLSCSSRWQPPQRRQLPAVSSHINPGGGIRAKWLLLRGDGLDSHGPVTAARLPFTSHAFSASTTFCSQSLQVLEPEGCKKTQKATDPSSPRHVNFSCP